MKSILYSLKNYFGKGFSVINFKDKIYFLKN